MSGLDATLVPAALRATFPSRYSASDSWAIDLADAERFVAEYSRLAPHAPDPANLARWLQEAFESQPAITIRSGVEPQVAWRALADELLRRWGR